MNTVWVVLLEERHIGATAYVFSTPEMANAYAWDLAEEYVHPEDEITDYGRNGLVALTFSEEGGHAAVIKCEVDDR